MKAVGTRAEVFHGTAAHTSGGLTKKDLRVSKSSGEIVSKDKAKAGKKNDWATCTQDARKQLGIPKGEMVLMNVGPMGKKLYTLTKQLCGK
jgi:hypothetical protein